MSLFDRWFGKRPPSTPKPQPEAISVTATSQEYDDKSELLRNNSAESSPSSIVVPAGHEVELFTLPENTEPTIYRLGDSLCVISLGHGSDEPVEEMNGLLRQLDAPQLWDPQRPVRVAWADGPLSMLFAPANPPVRTVPRLLIWAFKKSSLKGWLENPAHLQALLRCLYRLENSAQPLSQLVYFEADCGPGAAVLARLLAELGLNVKVLDPDPQRILLAKVHRPEGIVLIGLKGRPFPLGGAVDNFLAPVNVEKARAEAQGNAARLQELEQRERHYLAQALQPLQGQLHQEPLVRAPRLCRLLRTFVDERGPKARRALEQELLGRAWPLLLIMNPDRQSMFLASFPPIGPALRVYPDLHSLQMAVKELGLARDSYLIASMESRDIFGMGAEQNLAVALNVYMTPYTPAYMFWLPDEAKRMARGELAKLPSEQISALLAQTDVYIEQGDDKRALRFLENILSVESENLEAHERAYRIYVAKGSTREATSQLLDILRLCTRRAEVQCAQPYLALLLQQEPHHPELPGFLAVLRPGGRPFARA